MIKVIAFSDPHGDLPTITEKFDLLLVGGDVCPAHSHYYWYQREWLSTEFVKWVRELPFKDSASKVVFIGGNHDMYLDHEPNPNKGDFSSIYTDIIKPCGGRLIYLEDDEYTFETLDGETLKIYGTPWCKIFGNWWFMRPDDKLKTIYDAIPEDLDILLTHDAPAIPPHGIIKQGWYSGTDAGNKVLAEAAMRKMPKYLIYGHIHSSGMSPELPLHHELTVVKNGDKSMNVVCVSIKDENYDSAYEPLVFDIEGKKSAKDGEE